MNPEWKIVKLGEVLKITDNSVISANLDEVNLAGVYSFARGLFKRGPMSPKNTSYRSYNRLVINDFVMSQPKAWEGALALVTPEFEGWYLSPVFSTFRADRTRLEPRFFDWYCKRKSVWCELQQRSRGLGARRETVSPENFLTLEIPLPSLAVQRRIVERIEALAAQIEEARTLRQQAVEEAEVLWHTSLRQTRLSLLGSSHPKSSLGALTKVTSGGTPSRENPTFWNGNIPWIKTGELIDGDISSAEEHITQNGVDNSSAKLFPKDTILIALYGQGQTRGRTGRLLIQATTNQACCAVLPNPEIFDSRYIQYWLRSLYVDLREECQGGAQPNWNGTLIKNLDIALPPLSEQRGIIDELDSLQAQVDALKKLHAETASELDALMPAILDRAFKGEL